MLCDKCYSKTKVEATSEAIVLGIPHVARIRICLNSRCQVRFKTIELPESAHKSEVNLKVEEPTS